MTNSGVDSGVDFCSPWVAMARMGRAPWHGGSANANGKREDGVAVGEGEGADEEEDAVAEAEEFSGEVYRQGVGAGRVMRSSARK